MEHPLWDSATRKNYASSRIRPIADAEILWTYHRVIAGI